MPQDLPEAVPLRAGEVESRVLLGWPWKLRFRDTTPEVSGDQMNYDTSSHRSLEPPPVGSLIYVQQPLKLQNAKIPAGSILCQSTFGWSLIAPAEAIELLRAQMKIREPLEKYLYPDFQEIGALGAATLGTAAKPLVPNLLAIEQTSAMYAAIALGNSGDKSVITTLRAWRQKYRDDERVVKEVDRAIATLSK